VESLEFALSVPRREFVVEAELSLGRETLALAGPSGAGKSTVLRAIAGLVRPARGRIVVDGETWFDGERRIDLPPDRRSVGLVFQDYALFPHMTVRQNIGYGGRRLVDDLLQRLAIEHLAGARPQGLSGGERQRVALARALAREPRVLLLDEPMAALDPHTRAGVRAELRQMLETAALPVLLVTHDFADAAVLADRVAVMDAGRIVQVGTPAELAAAPRDAFVAALVGVG
jgi:molybdate transport system ATP-binding protein